MKSTNEPMQLDMLPLLETAREQRPAAPRERKLYGKPGTCKVCGQDAYDTYHYSNDEYKSCYVAHHSDWSICVRSVHRHPERHVPMTVRGELA